MPFDAPDQISFDCKPGCWILDPLRLHLNQNLNQTDMFFEQNVGDGANLFVTIVAVIIGFVAAVGYLDKMKSSKNEKKHD